jgi:hypothetical protein
MPWESKSVEDTLERQAKALEEMAGVLQTQAQAIEGLTVTLQRLSAYFQPLYPATTGFTVVVTAP